MKSFEILEEYNKPDGSWNYGVHYTEYFERLPHIFENSAVAQYHVYEDEKNSVYLIKSEHETCMIPYLNMFCLKTEAQDNFVTKEDDCLVEEVIEYECPLLLLPLCKAELNSQRTKVLENLQDQVFDYF